jgi:hypothetical protein
MLDTDVSGTLTAQDVIISNSLTTPNTITSYSSITTLSLFESNTH